LLQAASGLNIAVTEKREMFSLFLRIAAEGGPTRRAVEIILTGKKCVGGRRGRGRENLTASPQYSSPGVVNSALYVQSSKTVFQERMPDTILRSE
jgi:hypothetical protein